jgi:2-polyprenyl-3-methyl-5-hydroxy-6-metoxy-1,4-benzoquinol methylase
MIKIENCIICGSSGFTPQFKKQSVHGDDFTLVKCQECGLKFLAEVPDESEMRKYYSKEYFLKRTERGYDNYFSDSVRNEIERVFRLNLADLGFNDFEKSLYGEKCSLDIGCAAGYFVNYLKTKRWNAAGIDVSEECVDFAKGAGLDVITGDYLKQKFGRKFDLITLWASLEHLHHPDLILNKIHQDLNNNGRLYISTCRGDGLNFMKLFGSGWRFYNFPEHIYFFSRKTIGKILENNGFKIDKYFTYGSNLGRGGSAIRKIGDKMAKKFFLGDMMIVSARKI